jgi:hypothetical protein
MCSSCFVKKCSNSPFVIRLMRLSFVQAEQVVKAAEAEPEKFGHLVEKMRPRLGKWTPTSLEPRVTRNRDCISPAKGNCL